MLQKFKRPLITIMIMIMIFSAVILVPAYPARAAGAFTDIDYHWARNSITRWEAFGALRDFAPGRFSPDAPITRAEFFAILVRTLGATEKADISRFSDVAPEDWYYDIVAMAFNMGIANGYDDGLMRPNDNLLRQDAITLLARAMGMNSPNTWILSDFYDHTYISPYAQTYIAWFIEKGLLNGYPDGTLRPRNFLTRAEAIRFVDNIFPNIHLPEPTFHNVYLHGGLLVPKGDAELRDMVLNGDVVIGDGVGDGNVLISNCTINGRLIVRGGGPNSVTLSNSTVNAIYVASFGADTHVAVTDNSVVPEVEAVSGFTLSGSGVTTLTILDQAREGSVVGLNGVALDEFNIGGRGAIVNLYSGRSLNIRFDGAGQNARLSMAVGTSAENITIAAPNVTVWGQGLIRSLLVTNSGANIEQKPEFTTVGVNLSAEVNGEILSGPRSATPNMVGRASDDSLHIQLLTNRSSLSPFNQSDLSVSTGEGRSATEVRVVQDVSGRIPLTEHNGRCAYWTGFFIPAPEGGLSTAYLTYEFADGEPVTFSRRLERYNGDRGLLVYLPVFRKTRAETGQLKETLYINWGDGLTENIQFMSSALLLTPLTSEEINTLQSEFDEGIFYSVDADRPPYTGAEAVRRILSSDNPLGLPSSGNKGLDALNRAVTIDDIRKVLEERQFSIDLTIDTSGNSAYSRLSGDGKDVVAEAVLAGRKSPYATPSSVRSVFEKALNERLAAESSLLAAINRAGDAAALRKIIEASANAAILRFQTGADPYKSYPTAQKEEMARYLFDLRPYSSLQSVIYAIRDYLYANGPKEPDPKDAEIKSVTVNPSRIPASNSAPFAVAHERTVKITVTTSENRVLSATDIGKLEPVAEWRNDNTAPIASVSIQNDTLTLRALRPGNDTLVVTVGGKTANVTVTVATPIDATAVEVSPKTANLIIGRTQTLLAKKTPANATDAIRWTSSDPDVATVDADGIVTGRGHGVATITAIAINDNVKGSCQVRVFRDEDDVVVYPDNVILTPGASQQITAYTFLPNKELYWESDDKNIAGVNQTGRITAPWEVSIADPEGVSTQVKVSVRGNNTLGNYATVDVTVKQSSGVKISLENSVMYAGEIQQLDLDVQDKTLQNQQYYVQVTGGTGGLAAECVTPMPVGPNDKIQIRARSTGVGAAVIRVFSNPTFTGNPVSEPVTVIVSPMSVDGVTFDHTGTSGSKYSGATNYPAGTIQETQYGYILEMKLADRTAVTPKVSLPGSSERISLTQPMTWFSYDCDYNREIMREVKTELSGGKYYILDKDGARIGNIEFETVFRENEPYTGTDAEGSIVWRKGYFRFSLTGAEKLRFQREADMKRVYSTLLSAQNGRLVPDNTQPTGLAAVVMTPQRGNLTRDEFEEWGDLFYNTVELFVGGLFNPIIAPQSGFRLLKKTAEGTWGAPDKDIYEATSADISSGEYRIVDVNGNYILGNVPAIVMGDPNVDTNVFYVRILPDDLTKPSNRNTPVIWRTPSGNTDYLEQIGFAPGSMDVYKLNIPAPQGSQNAGDYPYLIAQALPSTSTDPDDIYITKLDDRNHYVIFEVKFPVNPPAPGGTQRLSYDYSITQYSKLGFAPIGAETPRQPAEMTSTGVPALNFTLTINPPPANTPLPRTIYITDNWGEQLFNDNVLMACVLSAINPNTANITQNTEGTLLPGGLMIQTLPSGQRQNTLIRGTSAGEVYVVITDNTNPNNTVTVRFNILPAIDPAPDPAPIAAANAPLLLPQSLGLDMALSPLEAPPAEEPPPLPQTFIEKFGYQKAAEEALLPVSSSKILKLRGSASVAAGNEINLIPLLSPGNYDLSALVWSSSKPDVATVDGHGVVKGIKAGKTTVSVSIPGTKLKASCGITVPAAAPKMPLLGLTLNSGALTLEAGKYTTLKAVLNPANATLKGISWVSSNNAVATVDAAGKVTAIAAGSATVTAVSDNGGHMAACVFTVTPKPVKVSGVKMSQTSLVMQAGEEFILTCSVLPENATNKSVTWSSNKSTVVTVVDGKLTAVKKGSATITVTTADGKKKATCKVTVK